MSSRTPHWTGTLDAFVEYFGQYYPGLRESIVPASDAEIEALEAIVGIPFPPEYSAFLGVMGNTPACALGKFLQYSTYGVQAVKDFYSTPGIRAPRDAIYVWTYEFDTPFEIFIRTGGSERDVRPLVQCAWAVDPESGQLLDEEPDQVVLPESLPQSLYKEGFLTFRDPLLLYFAEIRESAEVRSSEKQHLRRIAEFQKIAERLGFKPVPFMNQ